MKKKLISYIFFTLMLILATFSPPLFAAPPKVGVILPSLFITEELASFAQVVSYRKELNKVNVIMVNSKPDKSSLLYVYKFLKKQYGISKFIIKDENINLSFFYKNVSPKDDFFSFSPSSLLPKKDNIHRVVPTYEEMVGYFIEYAKKAGNPQIFILIDNLQKKDEDKIKPSLLKYKNKWKLLDFNKIFTPYGINEGFSFSNKYIFLYTTSYKKAGIFTQLIANKTKNFHLIIYGNLLSPSFASLVGDVKNSILVESDVDLKSYKEEYNKFRKKFDPFDFVSSLYDFGKTQEVYKTVILKKNPEKIKITINGLQEYE